MRHTGWAIVSTREGTSKPRAVAYGVISTDRAEPLNARLGSIYDEISGVIEHYEPTSCALEGVYFGLNAKTALALGQARAAAILATSKKGLPLGEYPPATVKMSIVGNGNAEKEQVAYMVRQLLQLDHDPQPDHCADALAVALTHISQGAPIKHR
ncbi:MAG: crossover junction endodeoxyribonuclease RuvC [Coriobacteriia bacterium]|nr:crossover junction endodeoxyribonuclease RuvC [Coriobacteriia bacterium]